MDTKTNLERQNFENKYQRPKMIANALSTGLSAVGIMCLFLPSSLGKTLSVASILSAGATLGVSQLTHKSYVNISFEQVRKEDVRYSEDLRTKTDENLRMSEKLVKLNEQIELIAETEYRLKQANQLLEGQVNLLLLDKAALESSIAATAERSEDVALSKRLALTGIKRTLLESLGVWVDKLLDVLNNFKTKYPDLEERLNKINDELLEKAANFDAQIRGIDANTDLANYLAEGLSIQHWMNDHFSTIKVKIIKAVEVRKWQNIELENQSLAAENEQFRSRNVVPREQLELIVGNYESRLKEFQFQYQSYTQQALNQTSELEKLVLEEDPVFYQLRMLLQQQTEQIEALKAQLIDAKRLKLFDDIGWKSEAANKVLLHFEMQGITCDACPTPIRDIGNDIEFLITPRTRIGMSLIKADVDKVAESLQIPLGVKTISVGIDGRNLKIRIPIRDRDLEKAAPEDVLKRNADLWSLYIASEYHLVIFAATQSGKTNLADELDAMMHSRLGGDIEFSAITLKNDGNRDEEKISRFVKPVFMSNNEEYRKAISEIHETIENRNKILQVNADKPLPRSIYQWDEYGEYYRLGTEEDKKAGKMAVVSILQRGAGLSSETGKGLSLLLIAQNPYVRELGISRPDLANTCIVICGEKNIRLFLGSDEQNHGLDEEDLNRLQEELKIFKAASRKASDKAAAEATAKGEDPAVAIRRCPENYYSIILPSKAGLKPIVIYNPAPGQFTNGLVQSSTDQSTSINPSCPDCKSTDVKKRSRNSDRYICNNSDCSRQTFTFKA